MSACRCSAGWHSASTPQATAPPRTKSETHYRFPEPSHHLWQTWPLTASPEQTWQSLLSADSRHRQTHRESESHRSPANSQKHARDTSQAAAQSHPPHDECHGRNLIQEIPARRISWLKNIIRKSPELQPGSSVT